LNSAPYKQGEGMLVSFSVSNYRSFGEEVTLNMVASNKLTDHPNHRIQIDESGKHLVRCAVLYGANAAGKSNLVKAMAFAQRLIQWRHDHLPPAENFKFSTELGKEPSSFEFRFLIGERVFIYGFDVTSRQIVSEWLAFVAGSEEPAIFERDVDGKATVHPEVLAGFTDDQQITTTLSVLQQLPIKSNQLFLNRIASLPSEAQGQTLSAILNWLTEELEIIEPDHRSCDLLERIDAEPGFRDFTTRFLDRIGTGIHKLKFEQIEPAWNESTQEHLANAEFDYGYEFFGCQGDTYVCRDPNEDEKFIARRLIAEHPTQAARYALPFSEESDGTQQILHYLPVLSTRPDENKVIVIDELDRSLHPLLCWEFIRFFSETCPGSRKQLIVTTHESHLLNQQLLRRDEYWFVEKDKDQQSRLSSLSEYNVRNDLQIQRGYLQGRFGAIPVFGGLSELECLLDCRIKEGERAAEETPT